MCSHVQLVYAHDKEFKTALFESKSFIVSFADCSMSLNKFFLKIFFLNHRNGAVAVAGMGLGLGAAGGAVHGAIAGKC